MIRIPTRCRDPKEYRHIVSPPLIGFADQINHSHQAKPTEKEIIAHF